MDTFATGHDPAIPPPHYSESPDAEGDTASPAEGVLADDNVARHLLELEENYAAGAASASPRGTAGAGVATSALALPHPLCTVLSLDPRGGRAR